VVRGEAGIGKSALLGQAQELARARGMPVLSAAGVQSEARLPFAGLHQLLRPVLGAADGLPARQRAALLAAFGMMEAAPPDLFLIALATLELLADTADQGPLLVVVEDAQWLDRPTDDVLAFLARRLHSEPIGLLVAVREGHSSSLEYAGVAELRLEGLPAEAAGALLEAHAPALTAATRERLLAEAAGSPLALIELPAALGADGLGDQAPLPAWLPLTARLERAFAARMAELPAPTRSLLLIAAADDSDVLAEILQAAAVLTAAEVAVAALAPAVAARLVELTQDGMGLRFRHPLVRSAIYQLADLEQRQAAHAALADLLVAQPDRRAWHLAAASIGPDEGVAAQLEAAAENARRRGAITVSVAAFERAAQLTPEPARCSRRLLRAAELALESGQPVSARRLLDEADPLGLEPSDLARMRLTRETIEPGIPGDPTRVLALVELNDQLRATGDHDLALSALQVAAMQAWWADPGREARRRVATAAERIHVSEDDPRVLSILGFTDPEAHGALVIQRAWRLSPDSFDPDTADLLGVALNLVGAFDQSAAFLASAVAGLRAQGRLGLLPQALTHQAWTAINMLNLNLAVPAAEEAAQLARETGQALWVAAAQAGQAMLAGLRGDEATSQSLTREAEAVVLPLGASAVLAGIQLTRGITALGAGRYAEAFEQLRRLLDPADPAYHHFQSSWGIGDFAEAALHTGHLAEAQERVAELEEFATTTPSPWLQVGLVYARPLLAEDDAAEEHFQAGLSADLSRWPLYRARLLLAYGVWLRRRRRVAESRAPLRAAREAFDSLGVVPWAERARQELRAAGETSRRRAPEAWDQLTPQELQIAQLAAEGLSNREIGQQLYLSHRTVGTHLYRIFPKLGVSSRSQLRSALAGGRA
jgi:DNA-binding CsgD family transcriptional regulator